MNCTACSKPIDKNKGYYLVMGAPYCIDCHQAPEETFDVSNWAHPQCREPENLLDAFRAHQKHGRTFARQSL